MGLLSKPKLSEEQQHVIDVLDAINDDNFADYADDPMFDNNIKKAPGWLNGKYKKTWEKYHYNINKDKSGTGSEKAAEKPESESTNVAPNKAGVSVPSLGGGSTGSSTVGNSTAVGGSTGGGKSGGSSGNSGTANFDSWTDRLKKNYLDSLGQAQTDADAENAEKAKAKGINTDKGEFEANAYRSLRSELKNVFRAKKDLSEAKNNNKDYQNFLRMHDEYTGMLKKIRSMQKKGYGDIDTQELAESEKNLQSRIGWLESVIDSYDNTPEWFDELPGPNAEERKQELQKEVAMLNGQRAELMEKMQHAQDWKSIMGDAQSFAENFQKTLGLEIDEFGNWAKASGSKINDYQFQIASAAAQWMNRAMEDGNVTKDELKALDEISKGIDELAVEEKEKDSSIMDAEARFENAQNRFGYYLFDELKSFAVFMVGLSSGNLTMAYSALAQYNKQIADAEAGFAENRINAFSNNDVKDTTGNADALYDTKQLMSELEKNEYFYNLKEDEKAQAVRALERAFEEYQNYVKGGNKNDFAAWFATQQQHSNGSSDWLGTIMSLIGTGALNFDLLKSWGEKAGEKLEAATGGKDLSLAPLGQGTMGNVLDNVLSSAKSQTNKIKMGREKQATALPQIVPPAVAMNGTGTTPTVSMGRRTRTTV